MPLYGSPMLSTILSISTGGMIWRMACSTRSHRRAVSSMRVPVGARTCMRIWPESTVGKKFLAKERRQSERQEHASEEPSDEGFGPGKGEREQRSVAAANMLKLVVETLLEPFQGIARAAGSALVSVAVDDMPAEQIVRHRRDQRAGEDVKKRGAQRRRLRQKA